MPSSTGKDVRYSIAAARAEHVRRLPRIELAAAALLEGHAPAAVLALATSEESFRVAQREGRLWVALDGNLPVGFALVEMLAPNLPLLDEIDVVPEHGQRGLGAALLDAACAWAKEAGHREIVLTTFRSVPWNMPFYARHGFEEIPQRQLRIELETVMLDEAKRGLAPEKRVAMRKRLR